MKRGTTSCNVGSVYLPQLRPLIKSIPDDSIQVSSSELDSLNLTSIDLEDGSGGIASLATYHALHCLVRVFI